MTQDTLKFNSKALLLSSITNETWRVLREKTQFPDEARQAVDEAIYRYHAMAAAVDPANQPSKTRLSLEVLAKNIQQAREQLARMNDNPLATVVLKKAIADPHAPPTSIDRQLQGWLELQISNLTKLEETLLVAKAGILGSKPGASGPSLRTTLFVNSIVDIWEKYSGTRVSRSIKGPFNSRDFILLVCEIADPEIGRGSIEDAVKKIIFQRGGIKEKTHT